MDEAFYQGAIRRIERLIAWFSLAGVIAILAMYGMPHAISFAVGSFIAFLSFVLLKRMVSAIGVRDDDASRPKPRAATALGMGLRYFIVGGVVVAVVKMTGVGAWPVLVGLLTMVAAVLVEIVYELVLLPKS